jgi:hypothetical protein
MDDLAGVLGLLATVHQKPKEKHQRDEELTADSPRALARAERGQGGRVVAVARCGSRQDPKRTKQGTGTRFWRPKSKEEAAGLP